VMRADDALKDEKKMRIPFSCHFGVCLYDIFIEKQIKQESI